MESILPKGRRRRFSAEYDTLETIKECEPLLNTKLSASIYFELISLNPKLFIHSEFKTQIANLKFENKIKQRAGLESIRKMIDMELIQIDIGIGSQV